MGEPGYRREMMLAEGLEGDIPERYYLIVARGFIECAPEKLFRVFAISPEPLFVSSSDPRRRFLQASPIRVVTSP